MHKLLVLACLLGVGKPLNPFLYLKDQLVNFELFPLFFSLRAEQLRQQYQQQLQQQQRQLVRKFQQQRQLWI